ncbi:hypothetical protein [Legionella sp. CNM-4043-24]|uniref:hypothetical protein n=1 Tax=Legionella sp. CNM-4043-24 TaxID=3421646 RepID=UPI00403AC842
MTNKQSTLFPWLMDDHYHARALVTYNVRLLDARLHQLMAPVWRDGTGLYNQPASLLDQLLSCCADLIKRYECLLESPSTEAAVSKLKFEPDLSGCYLNIQHMKQRMRAALSADEEERCASDLLHHYRNLETLLLDFRQLKKHHEQLPNASAPEGRQHESINRLLAARHWRDWLMAMVLFAQEQWENAQGCRNQLEQLSDPALLKLYHLFDQPDYISLINSLFLYKINPQSLYEQTLHPEKLMSVQSRLGLMHAFIEFVQASITQVLRQRGYHAAHDYLLHGNSMPSGVTVDNALSFREGIAEAVREWKGSRLLTQNENTMPAAMDELFQAYKFWFNPCRLIDAVMKLQQQLTVNSLNETTRSALFSSQLRLIFCRLTTAQCLDLYGYFSNKSSCYLMRSLLAVIHGQVSGFFPDLDDSDRQAVRQVYNALDCLMNTLIDELRGRHILARAYEREGLDVKPGRRIVQALQRILYVYALDWEKKNECLDQLFDELDDLG